jgi:hypothetical protein
MLRGKQTNSTNDISNILPRHKTKFYFLPFIFHFKIIFDTASVYNLLPEKLYSGIKYYHPRLHYSTVGVCFVSRVAQLV